MTDAYCSMIHGGLHLDFKSTPVSAQHCCLLPTQFDIDTSTNFWLDEKFKSLRNLNSSNQWHKNCEVCKNLEYTNQHSFRTGMNLGLGINYQTDLAGPARIDLLFDISCNLACRTCGPHSSTYWQKYLITNGLQQNQVSSTRKKQEVISALQKLDLSNLKMLVFCGGETLLGQEYWDVANWLADNIPNAKQQLTVCFQTNGTQPVSDRYFKIIEKLFLVKLHISLDGTKEQFEYLRWPADWEQVVNNLSDMREKLPSNVMFLIEETISIFNLYYINRLDKWYRQNFVDNREGDPVNHTRHQARGMFSLSNLTEEYVGAISQTEYKSLIPAKWKENPNAIKQMINTIQQHDRLRNQSWHDVFPEVSAFYNRYL
jgi:sulfatase maturation enzyme AslB (radical SAM superfamily)